MSVQKTLVEKDTLGNTALVSESGRTRVTAKFDEKGKGTIFIVRDNFILHRMDLPNEAKPHE